MSSSYLSEYNSFFSLENISIPLEIEEDLHNLIVTSPLSTALHKVVEYLISTEALVEPQLSEEESVDE